jgi:BirA family biotin operon repressor/biotin-[acetyl-CoA-carboxylase] ligase
MEGGSRLEILSFETLPSTQTYLIEKLCRGEITASTAVIAAKQTDGIGSRANSWHGGEGNFFASMAIDQSMLPDDLPATSASIYFAYLMKEILKKYTDEIWLKWPNDLYLGEFKVGGVITKKYSSFLVVGIGVNLQKNENGYSSLDTDISPLILLNIFLKEVEKKLQWKQIFSQYKIEFGLNKSYFTHKNGIKVAMKNAILCDDGSLTIEERKVYSLR